VGPGFEPPMVHQKRLQRWLQSFLLSKINQSN